MSDEAERRCKDDAKVVEKCEVVRERMAERTCVHVCMCATVVVWRERCTLCLWVWVVHVAVV